MFKAIGSFFYNFLFIDQKEKHLSHTKFWSNIGYGVMVWSFVYTTIKGTVAIDPMFWLIFGTVVIGNRTVGKVLTQKKLDKQTENK